MPRISSIGVLRGWLLVSRPGALGQRPWRRPGPPAAAGRTDGGRCRAGSTAVSALLRIPRPRRKPGLGSLDQQHVVGADHDELALDQRAGDKAPDRPAGGIPVGRLELLKGRPLGGAKAPGGWLGAAMPLKGRAVRAAGAR